METLWEFGPAIALALAVAVAHHYRHVARNLFSASTHSSGGAVNAITLVETVEPQWRKPDLVESMSASFVALGFEQLAVYRIAEMQGLLLYAFVRASDGMMATINEHPQSGPWAEAVLCYADGRSVTVSNNGICGGLDNMPGHLKHFDSELNIDELVTMANALAPDSSAGEALRLDRDSLPPFIEDYCAAEAAWLNDRGGLRASEVTANAAATGRNIDDATARKCARILNYNTARTAREACRLDCLDRAGLSLPDYEDVAERLLVVLKADSARQILTSVGEGIDLDSERYARLRALLSTAELPSLAFDAAFDSLFDGGRRLGSTERPATAVTYALPREY